MSVTGKPFLKEKLHFSKANSTFLLFDSSVLRCSISPQHWQHFSATPPGCITLVSNLPFLLAKLLKNHYPCTISPSADTSTASFGLSTLQYFYYLLKNWNWREINCTVISIVHTAVIRTCYSNKYQRQQLKMALLFAFSLSFVLLAAHGN